MLSALLVALREGVEAALVVGIVLVYLNRTGRRALAPYAWMGVGAAVACSFVAAVLLQRWQVNEDGFEGLMMIVAAVLVVTMIIWMNRIARSLKKEIEQRVEGYAQRTTRAAGIGIAVFVFTMVLREGAELVLILRAVELSSAGIEVWIGTGDWDFAVDLSRVVLLPGHAQDSFGAILCGDQYDFDGGGVSARFDGRARIERGAVDLVEQARDGYDRADCAE